MSYFPFIAEMKLVMNRHKHPFYEHSDAAFYIAQKNGDVVGRLAVLEKRKYNDYHNEKTAFFYFFESIRIKIEKQSSQLYPWLK